MKSKKTIIWLIVVLMILGILCVAIINVKDGIKFVSVKSEKELMSIYEGEKKSEAGNNVFLRVLTMPWYIICDGMYTALDSPKLDYYKPIDPGFSVDSGFDVIKPANPSTNSSSSSLWDKIQSQASDFSNHSNKEISTTEKEHSTTNIQVENVDEADITKTDGNYIYSISGPSVIITNVVDPANIKMEAIIRPTDDYVPEDLILYNNKLVVISTHYSNYSNSDTYVNVYDITTKSKPKLVESYTLYEKYYTSRCINGRLYVIASGRLRKENNKIVTYYNENNNQKEIGLSNIKYLKNLKSNMQTIIASLDLNTENDVKVNSYLFDVGNAYISEDNMYLLNERYGNNTPSIWQHIKALFGFGGIPGFVNNVNDDLSYNYDKYTHIYKFEICDDGTIDFRNETKVKGTTINQFSLDEYNENLRIGLYTTNGSRIVVFDKDLKQIGETDYLSKGEKMYSTRFLGNKAYMVTYKNTDPLYVIDLSEPSNPTVLGKLKIPGYSTYLHPYDENHLIGIGMQTEEKVYRNINGKVYSTSTVVTGMKMALFDVSDVKNPVQISQTIIGDSRTTSAILTNHKALLFSAKKGIIAIPVNNYAEDFEISTSSTDISSLVNSYTSYGKKYVSEGYCVYNINLTEGFKLKGVIKHNNITTSSRYNYRNTSKLLRGMWIEDNLYTVSEDMIKVNKLEDLSEICTLKLY